ncbi:MAG: hypothetical protein RBR42_04955 [Desulfomicrobium sp.]|nr:hypothetical protein [Desulfomicrobium sp.]
MAKLDPLSVRLTPEMYDRLMAVIQATGGEITKTEIIERSIDVFLRLLELEPSMIPEYDPKIYLSVIQKGGV